MTGRELYDAYADFLSTKNVEVAEWSELEGYEQEAWDHLANGWGHSHGGEG